MALPYKKKKAVENGFLSSIRDWPKAALAPLSRPLPFLRWQEMQPCESPGEMNLLSTLTFESSESDGHVTEILQGFEKLPDLGAMIQQMQPLKQSVLSPVQFSDKDLRNDLPIL